MVNIQEFEKLLLDEKRELEATLSSLGSRNPDNASDWETKFPDLGITEADKSDVADKVEEFDNALGIETVLEEKYRDVENALKKIKDGKYGVCEVGGEEIDEARLRANPAARTCMKHSKE